MLRRRRRRSGFHHSEVFLQDGRGVILTFPVARRRTRGCWEARGVLGAARNVASPGQWRRSSLHVRRSGGFLRRNAAGSLGVSRGRVPQRQPPPPLLPGNSGTLISCS